MMMIVLVSADDGDNGDDDDDDENSKRFLYYAVFPVCMQLKDKDSKIAQRRRYSDQSTMSATA